eukprot:CAMPEP_0172482082 /NCGR_PEP_ID=MMETSP1066-20121228/8359_1 /TAXON_ID=671091 /ORGANISM="Coscinodiscus wailesii, Strain CCMP2513" /LENGTH=367 /DNA_ID=CAMNT_0013244955 /DNA_START=131 /DNA_END=1234 /DNA_ORIENTATION=+
MPHPTLTRITGLPSCKKIRQVHSELNANASSIQSTLGDCVNGLLYLTLTPQQYATVSGVPFTVPVHPGPRSVIPENASPAQIAQLKTAYDMMTNVWLEYTNTDKALKQQLLRAVEDIYLRDIKHSMTGYANVSTRRLLGHLYSKYGRITPEALKENGNRMRKSYDMSQPIQTLWVQIQEANDYAAAGGVLYSLRQILDIVYTLLAKTGHHFRYACREWRRVRAAQRTWQQFKNHFTKAYNDSRTYESTANFGYAATNHVFGAETVEYMQDTQEALTNLANAAVADKAFVTQLVENNTKLVAQLEILTAQLTQKKLATQTRKRHKYCWTCGFQDGHDSANCPNPAEGHVKEVVSNKRMGGSKVGKCPK